MWPNVDLFSLGAVGKRDLTPVSTQEPTKFEQLQHMALQSGSLRVHRVLVRILASSDGH